MTAPMEMLAAAVQMSSGPDKERNLALAERLIRACLSMKILEAERIKLCKATLGWAPDAARPTRIYF